MVEMDRLAVFFFLYFPLLYPFRVAFEFHMSATWGFSKASSIFRAQKEKKLIEFSS